MKTKKRYYFFVLIAFAFILPGFPLDLAAQDNDDEEKDFTNVVISLKYNSPLITPFPQAEEKVAISMSGETPSLLKTNRIRSSSGKGWDPETGYLYYTREYYNHQIESPRYADYLTNAKVYGDRKVNKYWADNLYRSTQKAQKDKARGLVGFQFEIPSGGLLDAIAGESTAGLNVTGYQRIQFSGRSQWDDETESDATNKVSKFPSLDMKQTSRYSIKGTIGTKITVEVDQHSEAKTDLANTLKIRYKGTEDEIIQTIEAGNTSLSLPNTQFVGYSQRVQGLFGIKSTARVGPLNLTAIISQEKGSTESVSMGGGGADTAAITYIRDYNYLERTFFWIAPADEMATIAEILDYRIYVFQSRTDAGSGRQDVTVYDADVALYPNREDIENDAEHVFTTVKLLDEDAYDIVDPVNGYKYIEMRSWDRNRLIAGWFKVRLYSGDTIEIGSIDSEPYRLKMICQDEKDSDPNQQSFYNEWKNVYSLGTGGMEIDPNDIEIRIKKGDMGTESDMANLDHQNSIPYIRILGLDQTNVSGTGGPDGKVDANDPNILLLDRGYLIFPPIRPGSQPFNPESAEYGTELEEKVPEIYNNKRTTVVQDASKISEYYIEYKSKQRSLNFNLRRINIIENSERITLNGELLRKGTDYDINYQFGEITFKDNRVLDPNADLQIDYEVEPLISVEKKTLFGVRGEYEVNPNFRLGTTVLYKGQKSTDRKPRIGQETSKSLVWASDFSYGTDLPFMTKLTDALPFVEADAPSRLSLSGEIAQSRPNPNIAGQAYLDDFESSREAMSLGVVRYQWKKASAPAGLENAQEYRGNLIWFNPFDPYAITDIYNRDVPQGSGDRKTTLTLEFRPKKYMEYKNEEDPCVIDSTPEIDPKLSWGGIMRALSSASQNQTKAQLLELRMRVNGKEGVSSGKLIIHLGKISEDINGDGKLNTEDVNNNGILETFEDIGLDGLPNEEEPCYNPDNNADPSGDDYVSYEDNRTNNKYSKINGTEGNRFDAGGKIPDTEDLDGKGQFDLVNYYYEFVIDFERENLGDGYKVPNSTYKEGWETYRMPILEPDDSIGFPSWDEIRYARCVLTGFDSSVTLEIADFDIVSSRWEDTTFKPVDITRPPDSQPKLNISVISKEVDTSYNPPDEVEIYYDRATDTYEQEQSLQLKFENLRATIVDSLQDIDDPDIVSLGSVLDMKRDTVYAVRTLFNAENYAGYQKLRMFVHGGPAGSAEDGEQLPIKYIFRICTSNLDNYYQYQTDIYSGWDERNEVVIDFNEITLLKDKLAEIRDTMPSANEYYEGNYGIKGNPTLTQIKILAAAITPNSPDDAVSGEIWMNELRLTDVRDDVGTAMRFGISSSFSDFINYSFSYKKQDEYFRNLTSGTGQNLGSGRSDQSYNYNIKANLHKLLPPGWNASVPISYSYSESKSTPRLKPGSDIIIPEDQKEAETSRSKSMSFSISESFRKQGGNVLFGLLLNRLRTSYSYSRREGTTPTVPLSFSENYTAQMTYDLSPQKAYSVPIFFWLKPIPLLPKTISESQFGYLPTKLNFAATVKKTYSTTTSKDDVGYESSSYNRTLNGDMKVNWDIFKNLNADYSYSTIRDIRDRENLIFSFNPKKAKLGIELQNKQSFSLGYSPRLFKFLLNPKFSYRSSYSENADPTRNQNNTKNIDNGHGITISSAFSPQLFFGRGGGPKAAEPDDSTKRGGGISIHKPFLSFIRFFTNRLDDISGSFSIDRRYSYWGVTQRPGWKYIFGLETDLNVPLDETAGSATTRNRNSRTISYSGRTGVKFILGSKISTSYSHSESESSDRPAREENTTFPDLSFSLSNLDRYKIFDIFFDNLSFDTKYSRKMRQSINKSDNIINSKNIDEGYSPLVKLNFTWFGNLRCSFQYDKSKSLDYSYKPDGSLSNQVRQTQNSWQFSTQAAISSPQGIKLPLFGRLKSTLTLSLSISKRNSKSEKNSQSDEAWTISSDQSDFSVMPKISYSFSSNISGSLNALWKDSNDKTRFRKSHTRELGISVEIKF